MHSPLNIQMTPKAARDILDYLVQSEEMHRNSRYRDDANLAEANGEGANFVLNALGISRKHIKWTAEER